MNQFDVIILKCIHFQGNKYEKMASTVGGSNSKGYYGQNGHLYPLTRSDKKKNRGKNCESMYQSEGKLLLMTLKIKLAFCFQRRFICRFCIRVECQRGGKPMSRQIEMR